MKITSAEMHGLIRLKKGMARLNIHTALSLVKKGWAQHVHLGPASLVELTDQGRELLKDTNALVESVNKAMGV